MDAMDPMDGMDRGDRVLGSVRGCRKGELTAAAQKAGRTLPMADGLIAATAHCHCLHQVTKNTRDFERTGVLSLNPWSEE